MRNLSWQCSHTRRMIPQSRDFFSRSFHSVSFVCYIWPCRYFLRRRFFVIVVWPVHFWFTLQFYVQIILMLLVRLTEVSDFATLMPLGKPVHPCVSNMTFHFLVQQPPRIEPHRKAITQYFRRRVKAITLKNCLTPGRFTFLSVKCSSRGAFTIKHRS